MTLFSSFSNKCFEKSAGILHIIFIFIWWVTAGLGKARKRRMKRRESGSLGGVDQWLTTPSRLALRCLNSSEDSGLTPRVLRSIHLTSRDLTCNRHVYLSRVLVTCSGYLSHVVCTFHVYISLDDIAVIELCL